jgi:hypothetical protein
LRKSINELFGQAVTEVFVLSIRTHVRPRGRA